MRADDAETHYALHLFFETKGNVKSWEFVNLSVDKKATLIAFLDYYYRELKKYERL